MPIQEKEIHVGDIGSIFEVTVVEIDEVTGLPVIVDISTATLMQIRFKKPDLSVVVQTAAFSTDGTDGKLKYTSVLGDLDQPGDWRLQGYVEMPAWQGHTSIGEFDVEPNL